MFVCDAFVEAMNRSFFAVGLWVFCFYEKVLECSTTSKWCWWKFRKCGAECFWLMEDRKSLFQNTWQLRCLQDQWDTVNDRFGFVSQKVWVRYGFCSVYGYFHRVRVVVSRNKVCFYLGERSFFCLFCWAEVSCCDCLTVWYAWGEMKMGEDKCVCLLVWCPFLFQVSCF